MSAAFPSKSVGMRRHCVSSPLLGTSDRFLNNYSDFYADCVSQRWPGKSGAWSFARHALRHPEPHPLCALVLRVGVPIARARPPIALPLTRLVTAHALPVAGTWMRAEPATADPTRTGAEHTLALLGPADLTLPRFLKSARTYSRKQNRVISG